MKMETIVSHLNRQKSFLELTIEVPKKIIEPEDKHFLRHYCYKRVI